MYKNRPKVKFVKKYKVNLWLHNRYHYKKPFIRTELHLKKITSQQNASPIHK